jgi:hypothetical protein
LVLWLRCSCPVTLAYYTVLFWLLIASAGWSWTLWNWSYWEQPPEAAKPPWARKGCLWDKEDCAGSADMPCSSETHSFRKDMVSKHWINWFIPPQYLVLDFAQYLNFGFSNGWHAAAISVYLSVHHCQKQEDE